jgi:hypothetical protein
MNLYTRGQQVSDRDKGDTLWPYQDLLPICTFIPSIPNGPRSGYCKK